MKKFLPLIIFAATVFSTIFSLYSCSVKGSKEPNFYSGQQLLPDTTHSDTLRVVDAAYLNTNYNAASEDGGLRELINETCETEQMYRDNQVAPRSIKD